MRQPERWARYLDEFHAERPGITELVLRRCRAELPPTNGTKDGTQAPALDPYQWVAARAGSGSRVVDLACGSAPMYRELAGSHDYLGVDTSVAELRLAAERGAPVALADAARLPFADRSVDTVVSSMALMLLPHAESLGEVARVLRPDGRVVAMVPASAPLSAKDRFTYARLLFALRIVALRYPQDAAMDALAPGRSAYGLHVVSDERRRFTYPLERGTGKLLLDSLYVPHLTEKARSRAIQLVSRWTRGELGIPLRLVVMTKAP